METLLVAMVVLILVGLVVELDVLVLVQGPVGIGDHMSQRHLFAGDELLYDTLFLLKLHASSFLYSFDQISESKISRRGLGMTTWETSIPSAFLL